jgi:hypothetical protein
MNIQGTNTWSGQLDDALVVVVVVVVVVVGGGGRRILEIST